MECDMAIFNFYIINNEYMNIKSATTSHHPRPPVYLSVVKSFTVGGPHCPVCKLLSADGRVVQLERWMALTVGSKSNFTVRSSPGRCGYNSLIDSETRSNDF